MPQWLNNQHRNLHIKHFALKGAKMWQSDWMSEELRQCNAEKTYMFTIPFRSDENNGRKSNVEWNVDTTTSSFDFSAAYHKSCDNTLAIVDAIAANRAGKFINIIKCNQIAYEKWIYSNWTHTHRYPILFLHKFSGRIDSNYAFHSFVSNFQTAWFPSYHGAYTLHTRIMSRDRSVYPTMKEKKSRR